MYLSVVLTVIVHIQIDDVIRGCRTGPLNVGNGSVEPSSMRHVNTQTAMNNEYSQDDPDHKDTNVARGGSIANVKQSSARFLLEGLAIMGRVTLVP